MLAIAGTVPDNDVGLAEGRVALETDHLHMDGTTIPVNRGTPALLGAAIQTLAVFGHAPVFGFLADETAPHPFYTRGFILHTDNPVSELVDRAYAHDNAARYLLIKGAVDYVMNQQGELFRVEGPSHEAMEAIGGTGDTLTGIVSALISTGMAIPEAGFAAAKANRVAGQLASPTPAMGIDEIIRHIPRAVETVLNQT